MTSPGAGVQMTPIVNHETYQPSRSIPERVSGLVSFATVTVALAAGTLVSFDLNPQPTESGPQACAEADTSTHQGVLACARTYDTVAIVNVGGLDGPDAPKLSKEVLQGTADWLHGALAGATDDAIDVRATVYDAPQSVTDEVLAHQSKNSDGKPCIEMNGNYTTSNAVERQMSGQLNGAKFIIALGGTSCETTVYADGKPVKAAPLGVAHEDPESLIDIYSSGIASLPEGDAIKTLTEIELHELLHKMRLAHASNVSCNAQYAQEKSTTAEYDLLAAIENTLNDRANCTYNEYDDHNIMGYPDADLDPTAGFAYANKLLTPEQADYVSGRAFSGPRARTELMDTPSTMTLTTRGNLRDGDKFGMFTSLPKPIKYKVGADKDAPTLQFTHVAFDYVNKRRGNARVTIYLTNDLGEALHMVRINTVTIPKTGKKLTLGDKTFTFSFGSGANLDVAMTENSSKQ